MPNLQSAPCILHSAILLLFTLVDHFGVDDVALRLAGGTTRRAGRSAAIGGGAARATGGAGGLLLVQRLGGLVLGGREVIQRALNRRLVRPLARFLLPLPRGFNCPPILGAPLLAWFPVPT